jgi:hypothetical protein
MTLKYAKNIIAIQKGYPSWQEMESWIIDHNLPVNVAALLTEALSEAYEFYIIKNLHLKRYNMQTTISHNQRIFWLHFNNDYPENIFCNLHDIPIIMEAMSFIPSPPSVVIKHLRNNQFKVISKKEVNEMLKVNHINYEIPIQ